MEQYIPDAIFYLFVFCFVVQKGFLLIQQRRLAAYRLPDQDLETVSLPISVIISARNEAGNLPKFLPSILNQEYPDFEVVVVNDCSVDDTPHVLQELSKNYPHLKLVTVTEHPRFKTGKKFALTMGIKAAANEHLLFTDADCVPASPQWIARMAANFTGSTEIVLGYSPYIKSSGFLNAFTRFETLRTGINYLSAAIGRNAYMGIGRNLGYTKSLFFKCKGFASHLHVLAGDDDLFVNRNATADNTVIEIHPDAFTFSESKESLSAYYRQKKRHMGVGGLYKNEHRRMLSLEAITGFLFYISLGLAIFFRKEPYIFIVAGAYVVRLITQVIVYHQSAKKLTGTGLVWFLPVYDLLCNVYLIVFGLIGTFIKTTRWK
ncbi:glycosyltransferase [Mucilaginibacter galii]|uniref:Glycosyl transferase family 2 n=1 Tax=Mucilaginibacter galii TaxID=2005073 RepID=A0A917N0U5_9SPHI|nr:glycosyltransferase [Mucilaginibacter galii]GGI50196.1 glycosyl transferase family 2 [Mucilaginibacter galii]